MFLGFINTKISNNHNLLSLSNFFVLFYQSLPFWGKNGPSRILFGEQTEFQSPSPL